MKTFKIFQIFVLVHLCSGIDLFVPETLELSESLSYFSSCTITIITAKIRHNALHQNSDTFYEVDHLKYLAAVRLMVEYHKRDIIPTANICDNDALYTLIKNPFPINYENGASSSFPFNKYGCNVLAYLSPPQCKERWDYYSILPTSTYEFIPKKMRSLITGKKVTWETDTFPSILTKNLNIIIIVQKENMDIPDDALFNLDFVIGHNSNFRHEYQSYKLVFEVYHHPNVSNILKVGSIIGITDWNFDKFKTELEAKCGPEAMVALPCYQNFISKYSCKRNSQFCVANYEYFTSVSQALTTLKRKSHPNKWIIFGTSANQDVNRVKGNIFPNLNGHSVYLAHWSNGYYV